MVTFKMMSVCVVLCLQVFALHGYQGIFARIKESLATDNLYSRYQLYSLTQDAQNVNDAEFVEHIIENEDYYLTMIESFINKREYVGKKAGVTAQVKKIAWALAELSLAGACASGAYYLHTKDTKWKWPTVVLASIITADGVWSLVKGILYKKRMKQKLERDKLLRRTLREITEVI